MMGVPGTQTKILPASFRDPHFTFAALIDDGPGA